VVATTMAELIPGLTATGLDGPVAAEVKGRATMAAAIGRAVRNRQRLPARDGVVHVLGQELALRVVDVARAQEAARSANRPYNQARAVFTRHLIDLLTDRLMAALGGADTIAAERDELADDVRSSREVRIALNLCWMPMTPTGLIEELFANPVLLAAAAPDLSPAERAALTRPAGSPWTLGDVPLIDEAAELLGEDQTAARRQRRAAARAREQDIAFAAKVLSSHGGTYYTAEELADRWNSSGPKLTPAERAATDRTWVYGHIVVDEAQELSAMDWRTLLRRCPTRSMTIVGDTGQTHSAAGASNWAATLGPVLGPGGWREERLTINYRTPASIATEAQRVAQAAGVAVEPTLAARDEADAFAWVPAGRDPVAAAIETAAELAATGSGKMAVICPEASVAATRRAIEASALGTLTAAGWPDGPAGGAGAAALLDARLTVLDPRQAKGLEFDDVIVLGPEQIAAGGAGVRDLYVAMTRPTHRLRLVGSEPAWRPAPVDGSKRDSSLA
jgi:DNA helicase IV